MPFPEGIVPPALLFAGLLECSTHVIGLPKRTFHLLPAEKHAPQPRVGAGRRTHQHVAQSDAKTRRHRENGRKTRTFWTLASNPAITKQLASVRLRWRGIQGDFSRRNSSHYRCGSGNCNCSQVLASRPHPRGVFTPIIIG